MTAKSFMRKRRIENFFLMIIEGILSAVLAIGRFICRMPRYVFACLMCFFSCIPGEKLEKGEMPNVPLNPDETIIRQYHAAVLKTFKCHAYLTVTNQRLVISGHRLTAFGSVRSRISQQVSIASVSGVFSGYTRVTDWLKFGVCFLALSLGRYAYVAWLAAEKYIAMTGGNAGMAGRASALVLALTHPATARGYFSGFGWHGAFFLIVSYFIAQSWLFALRLHTAAASAPISLGEGYGSKSALLGLRGQPTSQSEKLTCELGQLVEDVRLNGDEAIARWAQKGKAEESFRRAA